MRQKRFLSYALTLAASAGLLSSCFPSANHLEPIQTVKPLKTTLKTNYLLISSLGNAPAEVTVEYSKASGQENTVVSRTLKTPFVVGNEDVVVDYDSIYVDYQNGMKMAGRKLKINPKSGGSHYLKITNNGTESVYVGIVSAVPMSQPKDSEGFLDSWQKDKKEAAFVVSSSPIYKNVPLLYLFKPELAPTSPRYYPWSLNLKPGINGYQAMPPYEPKEIPFTVDKIGEFDRAALPMSIDETVRILKDGSKIYYSYQMIRFEEYDHMPYTVERFQQSGESGALPLFYTLTPGRTLTNDEGNVWIVNSPQGYLDPFTF